METSLILRVGQSVSYYFREIIVSNAILPATHKSGRGIWHILRLRLVQWGFQNGGCDDIVYFILEYLIILCKIHIIQH